MPGIMKAVLAVALLVAGVQGDIHLRSLRASGALHTNTLKFTDIHRRVSPPGVGGMKGWGDQKKSFFWNFPDFLQGVRALVPSTVVRESEIEFECVGGSTKTCEAYVFMYGCRPCATKDGGDLPGRLLSEGWVRQSCRAQFSFTETSPRHDFVIYAKTFPVNSRVRVETDSILEFAFFGLNKLPVDCSTRADPVSCIAPGYVDHCTWSDLLGGCTSSKCPPKNIPRGAWQGCKHCVDDDRHLLDTKKKGPIFLR